MLRRIVSLLSRAYEEGFLGDSFLVLAWVPARLLASGRFRLLHRLIKGLRSRDWRPNGTMVTALRALTQELHGSAATHYFAGVAYIVIHYPGAAVAAFERALTLRPHYPSATSGLGTALIGLGHYARAAELLEALVATSPGQIHTLVSLGRALQALERHDEAISAYRRALALRPRSVTILFALADLLIYIGEEIEAGRLLLRAADASSKIYNEFWNGEPDARPSRELLLEMMLYQAYFRVAATLLNGGRGGEMLSYYLRADAAQQRALALVRGTEWAKWHGLPSLDIRVLPPLWCQLISHTAVLDHYFKLIALGWSPQQRRILLAPRDIVVNQAYLAYWRGHIEIVDDPVLIRKMLPASIVLGDKFGLQQMPDGTTRWLLEAGAAAEIEWLRQNRPPMIALKPEHRESGYRVLEEAGIPRDAWFVALHVRESGFYSEGDHPYAKFRNADISKFADAVRAIRARGGHVVRVGDPRMRPYPPNEGVFDYALSEAKSDWMDVFLCAACRFFIGSTSGLYFVPESFQVPCLLVNWVSFMPRPYGQNQIYIPKPIQRDGKEGALLSFREMMSPESRWLFCDGRIMLKHGLRAIDNTPDEITEAVEEMMARLDSRFEMSADDAARHATFDAISHDASAIGAARIGNMFLRRHSDLLER